ncbi:MAG TPA: hypothetical protein VKE94_05520 [Gemmataceae bacterium]|nr:hypothetical protein [Gemmataceae bacterium]
MIQPRRRARTLAMAVCAAAISVLSVSPVIVNAQDNGPTDPGVRCAAKVGPGQYEFYLPGERATDVNGNKWVCGADGQWFRDYSALIKSPTINQQSVRATTFSGTTTAVFAK